MASPTPAANGTPTNGKVAVSDLTPPAPAAPPTRDAVEGRMREALSLATNVLISRANLVQRYLDPKRSVDDSCGLPTTPLDAQQYQDLYDWEPIARRVVEVLPREVFQVTPTVFESEDPGTVTPFEEDWDAVNQALRGEVSWYQDEEGGLVWDYVLRLWIQSRIGEFGVAVLGIDDGKDLSQPAEFVKVKGPARLREPEEGEDGEEDDEDEIDLGDPGAVTENQDPGEETGKLPRPDEAFVDPPDDEDEEGEGGEEFDGPAKPKRKLLYIRCFPQSLAQVQEWEVDKKSPRYGQPTLYSVTFGNVNTVGGTYHTTSEVVHWTRVVHAADNLRSSETHGDPALHPVVKPVLSLKKLYYGSAEMYWRGALPGFALKTHPQLGGDVEVDQAGLREMMQNYQYDLQRYIALMGMDVQSLAPQVVDPTPQINVQIQSICIVLGIPQRIFMGSERGELASSQDDAAWNDRVKAYQNTYVTPRLIVPLVDRLILLGVLREPEGYSVEWPDITSQTKQEKAAVAGAYTTALAGYVGGGLENLMPPFDYFTRILGMDEDEAQAILDNAEKLLAEKEAEEALKAQEAMDQQEEEIRRGLRPDPTDPSQQPPPPPGGPGGFPPKPGGPNQPPGGNGPPKPGGPTPFGRTPADDEEEDEEEEEEEVPKRKPPFARNEGGQQTDFVSAQTNNAFCPTGEGGGQDNSCGPSGGGEGGGGDPTTPGGLKGAIDASVSGWSDDQADAVVERLSGLPRDRLHALVVGAGIREARPSESKTRLLRRVHQELTAARRSRERAGA